VQTIAKRFRGGRPSLTHHTLKVLDGQRPGRTRPPPDPGSLPARPAARSLYIHTPFCFHKCHYCDFYSIVDQQDRMPAFAGALAPSSRAPPGGRGEAAAAIPLETVFVGGGTPTLLPVPLWDRLLGALRGAFDLSLMGAGPAGSSPSSATPRPRRRS
jgi:oxygen-independent coproporphyrinogen-3 oxidase